MADGQDSTLILETLDPALSNITFDCSGVTSGSSGYLPDLGSLRLNEERRLEIRYSEGALMDGGLMTNYHGPLVPVTFDIVVSDSTRAGMMQKADALFDVVTSDEGGYLRYKPDGVGAGVSETYYHFVKSPPPALKQMTGNRWDAAAKGDVYRVVLKVTLQTQPFPTSNPASLTSIVSAQALTNVDDGTADYHTIDAADIKGSLPALCRVGIVNQVAGAAKGIGRFWLARRTKTLTNFVATYNTATYLSPVGAWSNPSDENRCGGSYYRCTPVASEQVYAIRFTISNWDSHIGRAAPLLVCHSNGTSLTDFDVYYRWTLAEYVLTGEPKHVLEVAQWGAILLGEIDLPDTEMSDLEGLDLYLDICVVRKYGSGTFDIDALKLLYTDECVLQIDAPSGYGAESTHTLLAENLDEEIAHIYTTSGSKLAYLCSAFGNFLTLRPDRDNRLDVAWLRVLTDSFSDDFSGYGDYWMKAADMESDEYWENESLGQANQASGNAVEGDDYWATVITTAQEATLTGSWDFARFAWSDYFTGFAYVAEDMTIYLDFITDTGHYYRATLNLTTGENHIKVMITDFVQASTPSWANITSIKVTKAATYTTEAAFDDLRFVLADPSDDTVHNDTGGVWELLSGTWHVMELDSTTKSLGCYASAGETIALLAEDFGSDVMFCARVRVCREDGEAGLVFRCSDATSGSEDMYGFFIDTANDQLELRTWSAGTPSDVATAVSYPTLYDRDYYLGVIVEGTSIRCYFSTVRGTLWDEQRMEFDTTDATHSSGQVGFIAVGDVAARFGDFFIAKYGDRQVPADTVELSVDAMFRTIFPFSE